MTGADAGSHLPEHIARMKEFQEIVKAYDATLKLIWSAFDSVQDNQHIDTMDEDECTIKENFLKITSRPDDTLDDRRRRIKGYYTSGLPYTENKFNEVLASMCGEDGYVLFVDRVAGRVDIGIKLVSKRLVENVKEITERIVPANLLRHVYVVYNRWERFENMKWEELEQYTWDELFSSEIFQVEEKINE